MKRELIKKGIACVLALLSVLNFTPYTVDMVARWLVGPDYSDASSREKAEMLLDMYMSRDFIYLSDDAESTARAVLSEILIEVISSDGSGENIIAALEALPIYERGERDTTRESFDPDKPDNLKFKASLRKLIENSNLPQNVKDGFYYFTDGINDVYIYFLYTQYDGVYEFAGDCVTDEGIISIGITGVFYDSTTHLVYGAYGNGILQIGFDFNAGSITMQNPVHAWQRKFGFNIFYDILGNMLLIDTQTVRVRFDYDGQKKMIQFWKGNYTRISNGAEIGMYNRHEGSLIHYDCVSDDELLYMSMKLYHGDELICENDRELHWWMTGYQPGKTIDPSELTVDCHIEFTEQGMLDAFMKAAAKAFKNKATIEADGMDVHIIWK